MSEPDELYALRTYYWLGAYQSAINESNGLNRVKAQLKEEKDDYILRSYVGLGQYDIVLSEVNDKSSATKRAIRLLALYLSSPNNKASTIEQLGVLLGDASASSNKTVQVIAATLYLHEDNIKEAYRILKEGASLEQYALLIQMHLSIFRVDLAQKVLKTMKTVDEDASITMLCSAAVLLATNKYQDAVYIYEELIDKHGASTMLLNSLASAKMQLGQFEEAETTLQEAMTKSSADPDSLANLIIVSYHLNRPKEVSNRLLSQLRTKAPNHPLLVTVKNFEDSYDRAAAKFA